MLSQEPAINSCNHPEDNLMKVGIIHSTESFGAVDGPGIRFLIFLQGCRMRCRYCHNPDTWALGEGQQKTVKELLDKAERYRTYWGSKGGITVSGGEALLQPEFVTALFEESHRRGIHTALDTAGEPFSKQEPAFSTFQRLIDSTDLVLLDIKHIDPAAHKSLTGHDNQKILDFARYLSEKKVPVWIRYVLVPGINDDRETLIKTRTFLDSLTNIEQVDILPYHTLGVYKWEELGYTYTLQGVNPPDEETMQKARNILIKNEEAAG